MALILPKKTHSSPLVVFAASFTRLTLRSSFDCEMDLAATRSEDACHPLEAFVPATSQHLFFFCAPRLTIYTYSVVDIRSVGVCSDVP